MLHIKYIFSSKQQIMSEETWNSINSAIFSAKTKRTKRLNIEQRQIEEIMQKVESS